MRKKLLRGSAGDRRTWHSRRQLQRLFQRTLLEGGTLAKPGTVEPVFLAASAPLVVHELGDGAQQTPGGTFRCLQFRATALAFVHRLHFLEGTLVGEAHGLVGMGIRLAQHLEEVVHGLMALDLALRERLHAVHEAVPLGHRNAQLLLHRLGIEGRAVGHLDRACRTAEGNGERVVADHPDRGGRGGGGQTAVAGGGQQQVAVDHIVALEGRGFAGTGQCPELAPGLENTSGFEFVARDLCEIPVELQHLLGLDHLIAARHHGQRGLGIAAVQNLLVGKLHGFAVEVGAVVGGQVAHRRLPDMPLHACGLCPDVDGLFLGQGIAQLVPRGLANMGHGFDEVGHERLS